MCLGGGGCCARLLLECCLMHVGCDPALGHLTSWQQSTPNYIPGVSSLMLLRGCIGRWSCVCALRGKPLPPLHRVGPLKRPLAVEQPCLDPCYTLMSRVGCIVLWVGILYLAVASLRFASLSVCSCVQWATSVQGHRDWYPSIDFDLSWDLLVMMSSLVPFPSSSRWPSSGGPLIFCMTFLCVTVLIDQ